MVYEIDPSLNAVSAIADSNNSVIAVIPVGTNPETAVYDSSNNLIYVLNYGSDTVSVINGRLAQA